MRLSFGWTALTDEGWISCGRLSYPVAQRTSIPSWFSTMLPVQPQCAGSCLQLSFEKTQAKRAHTLPGHWCLFRQDGGDTLTTWLVYTFAYRGPLSLLWPSTGAGNKLTPTPTRRNFHGQKYSWAQVHQKDYIPGIRKRKPQVWRPKVGNAGLVLLRWIVIHS